MAKLFLFFTLLFIGFGCQKGDVSPVDDGTLTGSFRLEIDPLRCSLPTTNQLTILPTGANTYRLSYDRFGLGNYQLSSVTASKSGYTKYELEIDGKSIGQYALEETRTPNGTQKKWILWVQHDVSKPDGLDFMGVKK